MLARAFVVNVIVVPLIAVAVMRLFALSATAKAGILLMALAPGIPFLTMSAGRKKGGSDAFAVTLSFVMPAASAITLPLSLAFLAPEIGVHLTVTRYVLTILLFQLLPLLVGIEIRRRNELVAAAFVRPLGIASTFSLLVIVALVAVRGAKAVASLLGTGSLGAILVLNLGALTVGWLCGGPAEENRRTLAIGSVLRNVGLAAMIATTFFENAGVMAAVVAYLILQLVVGTAAGAFFRRTATLPIVAKRLTLSRQSK